MAYLIALIPSIIGAAGSIMGIICAYMMDLVLNLSTIPRNTLSFLQITVLLLMSYIGVVVGAILVVFSLFIRNSPADMGLAAYGAEDSAEKPPTPGAKTAAPVRLREELAEDYRRMIYAETRTLVDQARTRFAKKWRLRSPAVIECLEEAGDDLSHGAGIVHHENVGHGWGLLGVLSVQTVIRRARARRWPPHRAARRRTAGPGRGCP